MTAMTEAETQSKWCPKTGPRLDKVLHPSQCCIGSACMAWRWSRGKETAAYLEAVQARMKTTSENFNVATQKSMPRLARRSSIRKDFVELSVNQNENPPLCARDRGDCGDLEDHMTQLDIELSAQCVASAIHRICDLAKSYPHMVRGELAVLSNASDDLAELVAKFQMKDAAE